MAEEKKIGAIKEELQAAEDSMLPDFIARYEKDERSGVKSLVEKAGKRIQKLEAEYARIENLKKYEKEYADAGYICGIDEVGRGPLAGPVVAGAVILPKDCDILYINDSKKLSASMREKLYDEIMEKAVGRRCELGFHLICKALLHQKKVCRSFKEYAKISLNYSFNST